MLERKAEMVELAYGPPLSPHRQLSLAQGVGSKAYFSKSVLSVMILVSFVRIINRLSITD